LRVHHEVSLLTSAAPFDIETQDSPRYTDGTVIVELPLLVCTAVARVLNHFGARDEGSSRNIQYLATVGNDTPILIPEGLVGLSITRIRNEIDVVVGRTAKYVNQKAVHYAFDGE